MDHGSAPLLVTVSRSRQADEVLEKHLTPEQNLELEAFLARNPLAGDVIQGTGGWRKLRWAAQGRGKSGGVRVIHFYVVNDRVLIANAYAKNDRENIDQAYKAVLRSLASELTGKPPP